MNQQVRLREPSLSTARFMVGVFLVTLGLTVGGCGEVQIRTHIRPIEANPVSLSVGVVLPQSVQQAVDQHYVPCLPLVFNVPTGELGTGIVKALNRIFSRTQLIRDKSQGEGRYDLLIVPTLPKFKVEGYCAHATAMAGVTYGISALFLKKFVEASGEFQLEVSDRTGQLILSEVYRSGTHTRRFEVFQDARQSVGEAVGEAFSELLEEAILDLSRSQRIRNYAQNLAGLSHEPGAAPERAPAPMSDVDALPASRAKPNLHKHALVIGVEKYRGPFPKASFADHDAEKMKEYLAGTMGYSEENVALLTNEHAAKSDIEKYVEGWLPDRVKEGDSVFVYYSGHGAPYTKDTEAYLVPYDGDPAFLDKTGYPLKRLYEHLAKLPAKDIVVVLDACFTGAGNRSVLAPGMRPMILKIENPLLTDGKIIVLAASAGDQFSSTYLNRSHGLLTYFFLKGLRGEADQNQDGLISLVELYEYVKPMVERVARNEFHNEQTPQLLGSPEVLKREIRLIERVAP